MTATLSLVNLFVPPSGYPAQYILSSGPLAVSDTWKRLSLTGYLLEYPTSDCQIHVGIGALDGAYMLVDAIQLEEGDLTDYTPAAPVEAGVFIDQTVKSGNIFFSDEVLQADMVTRNNTSAAANATLRYEIYDVTNTKVAQGSLALSLPASTAQESLRRLWCL